MKKPKAAKPKPNSETKRALENRDNRERYTERKENQIPAEIQVQLDKLAIFNQAARKAGFR
jgi:hypothetical protein